MSLPAVEKNVLMLHKTALWRVYVASNYKTYLGLHVKSSMFLFDFNENFNLPTDFHKRLSLSNFTEIRPAGVVLIHADGHNATAPKQCE